MNVQLLALFQSTPLPFMTHLCKFPFTPSVWFGISFTCSQKGSKPHSYFRGQFFGVKAQRKGHQLSSIAAHTCEADVWRFSFQLSTVGCSDSYNTDWTTTSSVRSVIMTLSIYLELLVAFIAFMFVWNL